MFGIPPAITACPLLIKPYMVPDWAESIAVVTYYFAALLTIAEVAILFRWSLPKLLRFMDKGWSKLP